MLLFLSDTNDNAPTLHPGSRHLEVCESAGDEPLLIQAEDGDLEPFSDPFTFELDNTWGNTEDTWKLGENRVALLFLLRCCSVSKAQRQGRPTLQEEGLQTLIPYNVEGGPACTQGRSDVRDQMPSPSANTTEAHTKLGAKLCGADVWEDDPGCRPRVYTEEGECEPAESLSSLAFSEHNLLLDLLDSLGPKAAPLEEIYSETAILSLKKSIF
ncbi:hypothetical protein CB1_000243056 [Camelus ferus]|nr:hypothetical protein CB1_000243056 [Camelus ferus]